MPTNKLPALLLALLVAAALLVGCGDDSTDDSDAPDPGAIEDAGVSTDTPDTTTTAGADDTASDDTATDDTDTEPATERDPVFPVLATAPTGPGPRPLLSWDAVDGATQYDLMVLNSEGVAYWGWSGAETAVYLGGVEDPDAAGAWVFEPLTWVVTARDAAGQPLALSEQATLEP